MVGLCSYENCTAVWSPQRPVWLYALCHLFFLVEFFFDIPGFRGADKCYNRTLCEEHLNVILPAKPPFHPRQFHKCAVVGNSGDLLKTEFGEEIDSHDAVFRDNEAPVNEVICLTFRWVYRLTLLRGLELVIFCCWHCLYSRYFIAEVC